MQKVIIIDSGLSGHFTKKGFEIKGFSIACDGDEFFESESYDDEIGHGTAVIDILTSYRYTDEISITMIKIFDESGEAPEAYLNYALNYIYNHLECDLIHISSGITSCADETQLEDICQRLANKNVILVSAFDNLGGISYPAACPSVIGVDYDLGKGNRFQYKYLKNSPVNILVSYSEQHVCWKDGLKKSVNGNSFIAPHISARILQYRSKNPDCTREQVMQYLENNASSIVSFEIPTASVSTPFPIHKAVVFPFNKEIHAIVRFEQLLSFEITDYFDVKYLGNINRSVSDIFNNVQSRHTVKNIEMLDWNTNFDTLILGHTDLIEQLTQRQYARTLIDNCLKYKKNLYAFDALTVTPEDIDKFRQKGLHLFVSSMNKQSHINLLGKLYSFSSPILAIFGTSSRQGKFTLQLELRKKFLEDGYHVGQLGSEPTSVLFGLDEEYPMGYNSGIGMDPSSNIQNINFLIHNIQRKKTDIMLVGAQSHTVPLGYSNIGALPMYQQDLLLGALPDACILCVNYTDTTDYILRTIRYISSLTETQTIALCISSFGNNVKWTVLGTTEESVDKTLLNERKIELEHELNIPVFLYDDISSLYQCVIDFF